MSTELDLRTPLADVLTASRPAPTGRAPMCVVFPTARPDCCGTSDAHPAEAFLRFYCGCAFTYCRHSLVVIYGRVKLSRGICPRHGLQAIIEGRWIGH